MRRAGGPLDCRSARQPRWHLAHRSGSERLIRLSSRRDDAQRDDECHSGDRRYRGVSRAPSRPGRGVPDTGRQPVNAPLRALLGGARAEFMQLKRSRLLVALTVVQAVTFLFLVSLFGMTGSRAPTAVIDYDQGVHARAFIEKLKSAHHSFAVRTMDEAAAMDAIHHGNLVAMIIIPRGFTAAISRGQTIPLKVVVDNIDTDMTDDIQRALPSAIGAFGRGLRLPGIHAQTEEVDLIDHDTDFIPY